MSALETSPAALESPDLVSAPASPSTGALPRPQSTTSPHVGADRDQATQAQHDLRRVRHMARDAAVLMGFSVLASAGVAVGLLIAAVWLAGR